MSKQTIQRVIPSKLFLTVGNENKIVKFYNPFSVIRTVRNWKNCIRAPVAERNLKTTPV